MPGRNQQEMFDRLQFTEEAMIRLRSSRAVEAACRQKYGVTGRVTRSWMKRVRDTWRAEATEKDVEDHRDSARETLQKILSLALSKSRVVKDAEGNPVMTETILPDGKIVRSPSTRQEPDIQRALNAQKLLMELDGLARPLQATIKLDAEVTKMPDLRVVGGDQAAKMLEGFLKAIAPDSDVSKVAGDMFKFAGEELKEK